MSFHTSHSCSDPTLYLHQTQDQPEYIGSRIDMQTHAGNGRT